jgi:hypothetical protein
LGHAEWGSVAGYDGLDGVVAAERFEDSVAVVIVLIMDGGDGGEGHAVFDEQDGIVGKIGYPIE